jgi:hypothetical protein
MKLALWSLAGAAACASAPGPRTSAPAPEATAPAQALPESARCADAPPASGAVGAIVARVADPSGVPLAGVTLVTQSPAGEVAELTDKRGHVELRNLSPGSYLLSYYYAATRGQECVLVAPGAVARAGGRIDPARRYSGPPPPEPEGYGLPWVDFPAPALKAEQQRYYPK